jgi:hypothetical protein
MKQPSVREPPDHKIRSVQDACLFKIDHFPEAASRASPPWNGDRHEGENNEDEEQ